MITSNVPNTVCADPSGITLEYNECADLIRYTGEVDMPNTVCGDPADRQASFGRMNKSCLFFFRRFVIMERDIVYLWIFFIFSILYYIVEIFVD